MTLPYTIAICDIDGTLLDGSKLSTENAAAVRKLLDHGLRVILATGRNHHHIGNYHRQLGLDTPAVTSDGALVLIPGADMSTGIIHEQPMPLNVSSQILEEAAHRGVTCLCFYRHGIRVTSRFDWSEGMGRHEEMGSYFRQGTPDLMRQTPIYKTLLYASRSEPLDRLQTDILREYGAVLGAISNGPNTLEFLPMGVSKVAGLALIAQRHGFTADQAIAFGDGANDVEMFRWAGYSVCMAHGHPLARAAATMVVPEGDPSTNFAVGVSRFLDLLADSL